MSLDSDEPVPLTSPWTAFDLPLEGAEVRSSSSVEAEVHYPSATALVRSQIYEGWTEALERAGWRRRGREKPPGATVIWFEREHEGVALSLSDSAPCCVTIRMQPRS